ncbi:pygopus homolog 2 [Latimeria chalumnae]|uniref:Pygopus family PHD finger 2 n=1 Tax=Latimeria chalumnae TaxID=7897 RepID=H3AN77_LATCH|nr:PREDICTED: pygopus homolog 2 [Latimeria chalumnae]|eukprot:XP_006003375.1 PREDICTED: pygopus homolog 2 [Latimeria chalumnae]
MAAEHDKLEGAATHSRRAKAGLQMKSPEKKRRKSSTQSAPFSHLSEFAPPLTPMVDHLVASNPFDDDYPPKGGAPLTPFLNNPGAYGNFRMQGGMPPQLNPGYGGGLQPIRRPAPPPFPPNQMGPGFNMPHNPNFGQPGNLGFPSQPFNQGIGQNFSPQTGQMMQPGSGPVSTFGPMMSPNIGQPPRAEMGAGPGPGMGAPGGLSVGQRFGQPGNPFSQAPMMRPNHSLPNIPTNPGPFPNPDQSFPPGGDESAKNLNPPSGTAPFSQEHTGSPATINGTQQNFNQNNGGQNSSTPEPSGSNLPVANKNPGATGHQPPPGLVYPCGACRNEVNDDQDAILCEASCQKWFHRECTGMTESAYTLLTREASAVWACDFCLKTKEIQSVYVREGIGQLVAANDG